MAQAELHIVLDDMGRVSITGPIDNQILCYGLLTMAHDALVERARATQQRIQPASAMPSLVGER